MEDVGGGGQDAGSEPPEAVTASQSPVTQSGASHGTTAIQTARPGVPVAAITREADASAMTVRRIGECPAGRAVASVRAPMFTRVAVMAGVPGAPA